MATFELTGVVLDAPDASALGEFYRRLTGWPVRSDEPGWYKLVPAGGGTGISIQEEPDYVPPTWPSRRDAPQMQAHLDLLVDDLPAAEAHALECGATPADVQPQELVRVLIDPVGHPFCLFEPGG